MSRTRRSSLFAIGIIAAARVCTAGPALGASPTPDASPVVPVAGEAWIAYQWLDAAGGDTIYLVRPDGTGLHPLLPDIPGDELHPDWSPDGARIAYVQTTLAGQSELWVVDADGTGAQRLVECPAPCNELNYPDWSPDGASIYYGRNANATDGPPTTFGVGRVDLATGTSTIVLTRTDGMTAEQPRISPDGSTLAYTRFRDILDETKGAAIFVADTKGGPETRLTEWAQVGMHPDWTPDGGLVFDTRDIMVFGDTSEAANLYVMAADGSGLRPVTTFEAAVTRASQPRVAPDGSGIVFTRVDGAGDGQRTMAIVGLDGTGERPLTPTPVNGTHAQLRPLP